MKKYFLIRVVKIIVSVLGGAAVTAGYLTDGDLLEIAGAAAIIVNALWTWLQVKKETPAQYVLAVPDPKPVNKTTKGYNE